MEREIKFRTWDGHTMKDVFTIDLFDSGENTYRMNDDIDSHYDKWPLMQYTGLQDRNGKDIYEGDILRYANNYRPYDCVIKWSNELGSCGCCFDSCDCVGFVGEILPNTKYTYSKLAGQYKEMEIIGNIHQNKNLLK